MHRIAFFTHIQPVKKRTRSDGRTHDDARDHRSCRHLSQQANDLFLRLLQLRVDHLQ